MSTKIPCLIECSKGLTSSNGPILGTGTCSNILLKSTVCLLRADAFRVNLADESFGRIKYSKKFQNLKTKICINYF